MRRFFTPRWCKMYGKLAFVGDPPCRGVKGIISPGQRVVFISIIIELFCALAMVLVVWCHASGCVFLALWLRDRRPYVVSFLTSPS